MARGRLTQRSPFVLNETSQNNFSLTSRSQARFATSIDVSLRKTIQSPTSKATLKSLEPILLATQKEIQLKNDILGKLSQTPQSSALFKPEKLTAIEWNKIAKRPALQYAVLEQIRDNCKELSSQQRQLKPQMQDLANKCSRLTDLAQSNLESRVRKVGHSLDSESKRVIARTQLDPLKPSKWKNEEGTQFRKVMNAKALEKKQDLLIMMETICKKPAAANAFHKLVMPNKRAISKQ